VVAARQEPNKKPNATFGQLFHDVNHQHTLPFRLRCKMNFLGCNTVLD
jgi:hypothetical protein